MLYHPESEWKTASPNQNLKWIIDYLKEYVPANLYPNDLAVFYGIFTQFFEIPMEKFHSNLLTSVMAQWSSRKAGILQWFKTNIPTEPPAILENGSEDDKKIWQVFPAYFQSLIFTLKRQENAYLAEQKTLKKGCNCASKPKPPRFYVLEHRLALIRNFGSIINQTVVEYHEWWKKVPTTIVIFTPTPQIMSNPTPSTPAPSVSNDPTMIVAPPIIG